MVIMASVIWEPKIVWLFVVFCMLFVLPGFDVSSDCRKTRLWCFLRQPELCENGSWVEEAKATAAEQKEEAKENINGQRTDNEFWWILLLLRVVHLSSFFFSFNLCPILLPETTISLLLRRFSPLIEAKVVFRASSLLWQRYLHQDVNLA